MQEPRSAAALDAEDPLAGFRDRFVFSDPALVYLDGNSLGRLPVATVDHAEDLVRRAWGDRLIRSWNDSWWEAPLHIGDAIAPLIGADAGEVAIADSTSVNLFKLVVAALRARPGRTRILTDDLNFPSDLYVLSAAADLSDARVEVVASPDGIHGPVAGLLDRLDENVALLSLSHVVFKSGYLYDMETLTAAARSGGRWCCGTSAMPPGPSRST